MKYGYCDDCLNKGMCDKCYRGAHTMRVETIENIILTTMKQDIEDMLMAIAIAIGGIIVLWFCAMLG